MARIVVLIAMFTLVVAAAAGAASLQSRTLVTYAVTGGFTGKQDSLTVLRSGAATSSSGSFRLSTRRLAALQTTLRRARFSTLRAQYLPPDPVADGYLYRVGYAGRAITVGEGAHPPLRLQRVLDLLAGILGRSG